MRCATAQVPVERRADLFVGRPRMAREQRFGRHHHAVAAIAALASLLLDEGLLQRVQLFHRAQTLDRLDRSLYGRYRRHAGAHGFAVDEYGAGAALREAAAELRAV